MNKIISFRELIDLEPKPKKVAYANKLFQYNGADYWIACSHQMDKYLDSYIMLANMKEPNIEIIEEDVVIEPIIYYDDSIAWVIDGAGGLSDVDKIAIDKINEIIRFILKKEGKQDDYN